MFSIMHTKNEFLYVTLVHFGFIYILYEKWIQVFLFTKIGPYSHMEMSWIYIVPEKALFTACQLGCGTNNAPDFEEY